MLLHNEILELIFLIHRFHRIFFKEIENNSSLDLNLKISQSKTFLIYITGASFYEIPMKLNFL